MLGKDADIIFTEGMCKDSPFLPDKTVAIDKLYLDTRFSRLSLFCGTHTSDFISRMFATETAAELEDFGRVTVTPYFQDLRESYGTSLLHRVMDELE